MNRLWPPQPLEKDERDYEQHPTGTGHRCKSLQHCNTPFPSNPSSRVATPRLILGLVVASEFVKLSALGFPPQLRSVRQFGASLDGSSWIPGFSRSLMLIS